MNVESNEFTGSASPERWTIDDAISSDSSDSILSETRGGRSPDMKIQTLPAAYQKGKSSEEYTVKEPLRFLGRVVAISRCTSTSNLDWAVIRLECRDIFSRINVGTQFPLLHNVIDTLHQTKKVQVFTAFEATTEGKITGTPTFMQVPYSIAFQEMWTVQLDGLLRE